MTFELSFVLLCLFSIGIMVSVCGVVFTSSLLNAIIYMSSSSLMVTLCYLMMDAPDVAMTEAAIGACVSGVVMISFVRKTNIDKFVDSGKVTKIIAVLASLAMAVIVISCLRDLTPYGEINEALHSHINTYYLENTSKEIGVKSFVAAILASYRGYDTLGETTVILTAAISTALILRKNNAK
ncbi:MAG: DUF4040 domain-containing protein [Rickettsiaceae bacterium]|nr:DUF4040 domain-containing protein [Rickettsiaceae bacterium]